MTYPAWFEKDGVKKLFNEAPVEIGWGACAGHYDFARGVWVDDEAEKPAKAPKAPAHAPDDDLKALRVEYGARAGKKPFMGWNEAKLREKIAALKAEDK